MTLVHSKGLLEQYNELQPNQIQPNAVDLTLASVYRFENYAQTKHARLSKTTTTHRPQIIQQVDEDGFFLLTAEHGSYSVVCNEYIEVPEGYAGWLIARSSLNRNGVFLMSGLYDAGFKGKIAGTMYVTKSIEIEQHARFAQLILARAETLHLYDGQYQAR